MKNERKIFLLLMVVVVVVLMSLIVENVEADKQISSVLFNYTFDSDNNNFELNGCTINDEVLGEMMCDARNDNASHVHAMPNMSINNNAFTIEFYDYNVTSTRGQYIFLVTPSNKSFITEIVNAIGIDQGAGNPSEGMRLQIYKDSTFDTSNLWLDNLKHNLRISFLQNLSVNISVDGNSHINFPIRDYDLFSPVWLLIKNSGSSDSVHTRQSIGGISIYNGTKGSYIDSSPEINISLNDTSLLQGYVVNVTGNSSDNFGLSFCSIITNQTGANVFYNFSLSGTSGYCGQNITIVVGATNIVNFTARINDTYNNSNQASQIITISDTIPPTLIYINFSLFSIVDGNRLNVTINTSDADSNLFRIKYNLTNPSGTKLQRLSPTNFVIPSEKSYILNDTLFAGDLTSVIGIWNLTYVSIEDVPLNIVEDYPNITFQVTSAGGGGGGDSGGGGGGGGLTPKPVQNITIVQPERCGNFVCESCVDSNISNCIDETPLSCPQDCKLFSLDDTFCTPIFNCGNWRFQWFTNLMLFIVVGGLIYTQYTADKKKKRL